MANFTSMNKEVASSQPLNKRVANMTFSNEKSDSFAWKSDEIATF